MARNDLVHVLQSILAAVSFRVQDRDLVDAAVLDFRDGQGDFADYLVRRLDARAGCVDTVTFDEVLEASTGFTLLRPEDYPPAAPPPSFVHEP
jgi:predicted nucleic-acid-binding protein